MMGGVACFCVFWVTEYPRVNQYTRLTSTSPRLTFSKTHKQNNKTMSITLRGKEIRPKNNVHLGGLGLDLYLIFSGFGFCVCV
jgi:hypothetical protein